MDSGQELMAGELYNTLYNKIVYTRAPRILSSVLHGLYVYLVCFYLGCPYWAEDLT